MKKYSRKKPFNSWIKDRELITGKNSTRKTFHISLDTTDFDDSFNVGDSLAIFPTNDLIEVEQILFLIGSKKEDVVLSSKGEEVPLLDFLMLHANLMKINRSLLTKAIEKNGASKKLKELLDPENGCALTTFLHTCTLKELLHQAPLTKDEIAKYAMPLMPRFYSIASSPIMYPNEIHLLVAHVQYEVEGQVRYGVGSHFLGVKADIGSSRVPIYIQPSNHFSLPEDPEAPIIMIGPGTGVAPFRAFMQQRIATRSKGKNWLFFGERNQATDFYYGSYWKALEKEGHLRLDTAFSRDKEEKVYVQHKMMEQKKDLWQWIQEGAYLYVCGDAKQMAKEVEASLCMIIKEEGNLTEEEALLFFRKMRKEKRYLTDVY